MPKKKKAVRGKRKATGMVAKRKPARRRQNPRY